MKLTNQARNELLGTLRNLERGHAFIMADRTLVCVKTQGTTTIEYKGPDGFIQPINKYYGSDLTGFENALSTLKRFLETH